MNLFDMMSGSNNINTDLDYFSPPVKDEKAKVKPLVTSEDFVEAGEDMAYVDEMAGDDLVDDGLGDDEWILSDAWDEDETNDYVDGPGIIPANIYGS